MKPQVSINVNVVKPLNWDELNIRYSEAVSKMIKNRISPYFIEEFIEKLKLETSLSDETYRRDSHESSSNL